MMSFATARLLAAFGIAFFTAEAFLNFGYKFLEQRIDDPAADFLPPLIDELTGAYGALLLMPFVVLMLYRYPLQRGTLLVRIPLHLSILVVYSVLHTLWNAATREVAYGLAGREYD